MSLEWPAALRPLNARLSAHIAEHLRSEQVLEEAYTGVAEENGSAYVAFLLRLVAEDEARHHRLLNSWMAALHATDEGRDDPDALPMVEPMPRPTAVLDAVDRFLAVERRDARDLRGMVKELRSLDEVTLWPLLAQLMLLDTQKHIAILEFVRHHARHDERRERSEH